MKHKPNLNTVSGPAPQFDAEKIRNRGEAERVAAHKQHERNLARLDTQPAEKGGRGK